MPNKHNTVQDLNHHPEAGEPWSDTLAQWYIENYGEHPSYTVALLAMDLTGTESVLDIGCGNGTAVRAVAQRLPRGKAIGIDPTPAMIRAAVEQTQHHPARERIQFFEAPAEELPIDTRSLDVVFAVGSLHHWGDIPKGLAEIARVLKPGGRLIVVEDIFNDPEMGMDIQSIHTMISASAFNPTSPAEQSHSAGRVHVLLASLEDPQ